MAKPILIVRINYTFSKEQRLALKEHMEESGVYDEYHVLVVGMPTDTGISFEVVGHQTKDISDFFVKVSKSESTPRACQS